MKKWIAALILGLTLWPGASSAVEIRIRGVWDFGFEYGQGGQLADKYGGRHITGFGKGGVDEFNAMQRLRTWAFFRMSEDLQGILMFKIPSVTPQHWGQGAKGGALGADGTEVALKIACLDWRVPKTDLRLRMGIQYVGFPSFTGQNMHLDNTAAAVTASYRFSDAVSLTALWLRPVNDNWEDYAGVSVDNPGYLDNVDIFGLFLPLTFEDVKVTPWIAGGMAGRNARSGQYVFTNMFWDKDLSAIGNRQNWERELERLDPYGKVLLAGFTGELVAWDPFRFAWDFQYGGNWSGCERYDRRGWTGALLAEYRLDWGVPGIYGWYASGEDGNASNGSERLFVLSPLNFSGRNDFSALAFYGAQNQIARQALLSNTFVGTAGVGVRIKDFSLMKDLRQTARLVYINGTNDKKSLNDRNALAVPALQDLLLSKAESAVEASLSSEYKIYDNLKLYSEIGYLAMNRRQYAIRGDERKCDAWSASFIFTYEF